MIEFIWPWLLILLPAPLIMRFLPARKPNSPALWWPTATLLSAQESPFIMNKQQFFTRYLWLLCAWVLLVLAIARPVWVGEPTQVTPSGRDLLIALDLSGSMQVTDMQVNQAVADRLEAAKHVLEGFIEARQGDRIGVVVFGSKAYLQAPLSFDLKTINQLINETQIGFAGEQTAIGDAIGLGIKRLSNKESDKRVMILMTDGANTAGRVQPAQAAQFAATQQVKIHTIGIGADEMVVQGFFGPKVIDPSADLDEALLQEIATTTGGHYFRARSTEELQNIYALLDKLEPTPSEALWQRPKTTLLHWLGLISLFFVALTFVTNHRFKLQRGSFWK